MNLSKYTNIISLFTIHISLLMLKKIIIITSNVKRSLIPGFIIVVTIAHKAEPFLKPPYLIKIYCLKSEYC